MISKSLIIRVKKTQTSYVSVRPINSKGENCGVVRVEERNRAMDKLIQHLIEYSTNLINNSFSAYYYIKKSSYYKRAWR